MAVQGFSFPGGGHDDPVDALVLVADFLRLQPEDDAEVGPWDDSELYRTRRIEVSGSDDLISQVAVKLADAGLPAVQDWRAPPPGAYRGPS